MDFKPDQTAKIQFTYPATVNCENAMLRLPQSELLSPFSTSSAPLKPGSSLIIPYFLAILGIAVLLLFYGQRRAGTDLGSIMNYTELDMQDWQYEVANGDTVRGFHDWLAAQEEANA